MSENPYYPYSSYEAWRAVAGLPVVKLDDKQAMIEQARAAARAYNESKKDVR